MLRYFTHKYILKDMNITQLACLRCERSWWPKSPATPKVCPACKSPYWDTPRKERRYPFGGGAYVARDGERLRIGRVADYDRVVHHFGPQCELLALCPSLQKPPPVSAFIVKELRYAIGLRFARERAVPLTVDTLQQLRAAMASQAGWTFLPAWEQSVRDFQA